MIWTFYEVAKSTGFLAHPWGLLAHPLHSWIPLIQIVDSLGVFGLGFFVALANSALAFSLADTEALITKRVLLSTLASFGIFSLYGSYTLSHIAPPSVTIPLLLIQTNEDPWGSASEISALQTTIDLSQKALAQHPQTQLVIWSETLLKQLYYNSFYQIAPAPSPLHEVLSRYPVYWLIGAPSLAPAPITAEQESWLKERLENHPFLGNNIQALDLPLVWVNSPAPREIYEPTNNILLLSPDGHLRNSYAKRSLFPLRKTFPFLKFLPSLGRMRALAFAVSGEKERTWESLTGTPRGILLNWDS